MSVDQDFWKTQHEQLQGELAELEERLGSPVMPGELESWLEEVRTCWQSLWPQLQMQTQYIHAKEFAQIAEEDPELSARVREMREEDTAIMALCDQVADQLTWIEDRLEKGITESTLLNEPSPDSNSKDVDPTERDFHNEGAMEADLKQDLEQFVTAGLALVTRIRKQEITIRTWLVEAYTRDRGVMD